MTFWQLVLAIAFGVFAGRFLDAVAVGIMRGIKKNRARYKK